MFKGRKLLLTASVALLLVLSAAPIVAQDATDDGPGYVGPLTGGKALTAGDATETLGYFDETSVVPQSISVSGAMYDPTVLTKFIPGDAFVPSVDLSDTVQLDYSGSCVSPGSNSLGSVVLAKAPIELPQGALLLSVTFHGKDSDAGSNMTFTVDRGQVYSPGLLGGTASLTSETVATGSSSGLSGIGSVYVDVDPDLAAGYVGGFLTGFTKNFFSLGWQPTISAGENHTLCGATVAYQVQATGDNQTFTPVEPCAIFDSRTGQGGTGAFAANEIRSFTVTGDTSGVGGDGNCGINAAATAVQTNILVLSPAGTGTLKAWAQGGTEPAGLVAFTNDLPRWNGSSTIPIAGNDQMSLKMQNSSGDVRLIVTGYYSPMSNMGN